MRNGNKHQKYLCQGEQSTRLGGGGVNKSTNTLSLPTGRKKFCVFARKPIFEQGKGDLARVEARLDQRLTRYRLFGDRLLRKNRNKTNQGTATYAVLLKPTLGEQSARLIVRTREKEETKRAKLSSYGS